MKKKNKLLRTWCASCLLKKPPNIERAVFWCLVRSEPYGLALDGFNIDEMTVGLCASCLEEKTAFQRSTATVIIDDIDRV